MFDYISIYLAVSFRTVFFSLEDLDPIKHEHDEMHWQYSWIFLPLKIFWTPTHGRAKKREFENNIHKHTAEGYWTGERNAILSIDTVAMLDLLTSRAFERVSATVSAKRERAKAGSYHTRPENQANDFEKVYSYVHSAGSRPWDGGWRGVGSGLPPPKFFGPFGPQFGPKIRRARAGPFPGSATGL